MTPRRPHPPKTQPTVARARTKVGEGARFGDGGFVLVNALVLVAALAAVATLLLSRAEQGRHQLETALMADQLALSLDGFDALALTRLARDQGQGTGQSSGNPVTQARTTPPLTLARGTVQGEIHDLQGRFNVNWLSDPDNTLAQTAFDRLLAQLGLPPQIAADIRRFVTPGALREAQAPQLSLTAPSLNPQHLDPVPLDPVGGPLLSGDQLADLPGLSPRAYARLRPLITALPGDSRLNVNTAAPEVLSAFLSDLPAAALSRLIQSRAQSPFPSVEAFLIAARLQQAENQDEAETDPDPSQLGPDQLTISSGWFRIDSQAALAPLAARRVTILHRKAPGQRPELIWQVTQRP